jgi:hypothetical protein
MGRAWCWSNGVVLRVEELAEAGGGDGLNSGSVVQNKFPVLRESVLEMEILREVAALGWEKASPHGRVGASRETSVGD